MEIKNISKNKKIFKKDYNPIVKGFRNLAHNAKLVGDTYSYRSNLLKARRLEQALNNISKNEKYIRGSFARLVKSAPEFPTYSSKNGVTINIEKLDKGSEGYNHQLANYEAYKLEMEHGSKVRAYRNRGDYETFHSVIQQMGGWTSANNWYSERIRNMISEYNINMNVYTHIYINRKRVN